MVRPVRLLSALAALLLVACAVPAAAADERSALRNRCFRMHQLWQRYETEHCPNTTGQRAQAEWSLYRCQVWDLDRGVAELTRLLRRDLIPLP